MNVFNDIVCPYCLCEKKVSFHYCSDDTITYVCHNCNNNWYTTLYGEVYESLIKQYKFLTDNNAPQSVMDDFMLIFLAIYKANPKNKLFAKFFLEH